MKVTGPEETLLLSAFVDFRWDTGVKRMSSVLGTIGITGSEA